MSYTARRRSTFRSVIEENSHNFATFNNYHPGDTNNNNAPQDFMDDDVDDYYYLTPINPQDANCVYDREAAAEFEDFDNDDDAQSDDSPLRLSGGQHHHDDLMGNVFVGHGGRNDAAAADGAQHPPVGAVVVNVPQQRRSSSMSLVFPTGIDTNSTIGGSSEFFRVADAAVKRRRSEINIRLDQCEGSCYGSSTGIRQLFPFQRKRLLLNNMDLTFRDVPIKDICGGSSTLGNTLFELSLANNTAMSAIPPRLVAAPSSLPILQILDVSNCGLHDLPDIFQLPKLRQLNLNNNHLTEFLDESILAGIPNLQQLYMKRNKIHSIALPTRQLPVLSKLQVLDLSENEIVSIPDTLDSRFRALRTLKLAGNSISHIPVQVCCHIKTLKVLEIHNNPIVVPPMEVCERGIRCMKRYWQVAGTTSTTATITTTPSSGSRSRNRNV